MNRLPLVAIGLSLMVSGCGSHANHPVSTPAITYRITESGVHFGALGRLGHRQPTLIMLKGTIEDTLTGGNFSHLGDVMHGHGWLVVSIDVPCEGQEQRPGEPAGLAGWRYRVEAGEDIAVDCSSRVSNVVDYLIAHGFSDPERISIAGNSRGGFMALHASAMDPRIQSIATFHPATELMRLTEFNGITNPAFASSLDVVNKTSLLIDRPLWMTIGTTDNRVGTDAAVSLWNTIVTDGASVVPLPDRFLLLNDYPGHVINEILEDEAADWLLWESSHASG